MRDEEEEQRKEKRKKLDEKLYRNFCRTKFYRWISLGEKKKKNRRRERPHFYLFFCIFLYFVFLCHRLPFSFFLFYSLLQRTNLFRPETELSGICLSVVNGFSGFSQARKAGKRIRREMGGHTDEEHEIRRGSHSK